MSDAGTVLSIRGLKKTFRKGFWGTPLTALAGVDLAIARGEVFGMLGANGAGKSTTFRIVAGMIAPTSGEVRVFDRPATDPESRRRIGYLPDQPAFYDFLTAAELLTLCARLSGMPSIDIQFRITELLELVGLRHARDQRLRTFSKGMLQRLGIAQALIHDPALLLLDEPMSGLDPIGRKDLREILLRLKQSGKTIVFSSHILQDFEVLCDRIGVLEGGRLSAIENISPIPDNTSVYKAFPSATEQESCTL
jgi:ABC-2 type transport system ATP-binding protein